MLPNNFYLMLHPNHSWWTKHVDTSTEDLGDLFASSGVRKNCCTDSDGGQQGRDRDSEDLSVTGELRVSNDH